jgi:hypothetical protein
MALSPVSTYKYNNLLDVTMAPAVSKVNGVNTVFPKEKNCIFEAFRQSQ